MSIKNILVHIDHSKACEHRVNTAIELANQYNAKLSALFVIPDYFVPSYVEAQISADIIGEISEQAMARARETVHAVGARVKSAGLSMQAYIEEGNLIATINDYARYTDLVILGQSQSDDSENISEALADHVALEGGSPCLVVPYIGCRDSIGKRVLVAWNASRESARALKDAMPILEQADKVTVLLIKPKNHHEERTVIEEKVVLDYLKDHDINAEVSLCIGNTIDPGDTMLNQASDHNCDLIVMGAYGHSRLREIVLGGATRHLLKQMTVPVFISH